MNTEVLRAAVSTWLGEEVGPEALWIGAWPAPAPFPPVTDGAPLVRACYALPEARVASLRGWRDTAEARVDVAGVAVHVVAHEASKWARLLLKSHGEGIRTCAMAPIDDPHGLLRELGSLAARCADGDARAWCEASGQPAAAESQSPLSGSARFTALDAWVARARTKTGERG